MTAAATTNVPASMRSGTTRWVGAAQPLAALDLDRVGAVRSTSAPMVAQEGDEVVDLGLLGGRAG